MKTTYDEIRKSELEIINPKIVELIEKKAEVVESVKASTTLSNFEKLKLFEENHLFGVTSGYYTVPAEIKKTVQALISSFDLLPGTVVEFSTIMLMNNFKPFQELIYDYAIENRVCFYKITDYDRPGS